MKGKVWFGIVAFILFGYGTSFGQKSPKFKKLIYHTSVCFGFCPVFHMEIKKCGKIFVHKEKVFDRDKSAGKNFVMDSTQIGYFKGKISKAEVRKINELIQMTNLPSLKTDSVLCCDGSLKTIILYQGGNRYEYKTMFPRDRMEELTALLSEIAATKARKKLKRSIVIEEGSEPRN